MQNISIIFERYMADPLLGLQNYSSFLHSWQSAKWQNNMCTQCGINLWQTCEKVLPDFGCGTCQVRETAAAGQANNADRVTTAVSFKWHRYASEFSKCVQWDHKRLYHCQFSRPLVCKNLLVCMQAEASWDSILCLMIVFSEVHTS